MKILPVGFCRLPYYYYYTTTVLLYYFVHTKRIVDFMKLILKGNVTRDFVHCLSKIDTSEASYIHQGIAQNFLWNSQRFSRNCTNIMLYICQCTKVTMYLCGRKSLHSLIILNYILIFCLSLGSTLITALHTMQRFV